MPKVSTILADRRTLPVDLGDGETLTITYRPGGVTPETEEKFLNMVDSQRSGNALAQFLSNTMVAWDLVGDDEKPYPINEKALRKLPTVFLGILTKAITDDMRPNPPSAATSNGGSIAAA